jgi:hypothetical protein
VRVEGIGSSLKEKEGEEEEEMLNHLSSCKIYYI